MTALPRESQGIVYWHKKWSVSVSIRSILFYGYPSMRVPPESRMVVKRFPSRHPFPLPVGRWPAAARTEKGQITATSIGKCWHLRRQMTSRGRKALSVTCGDSSPKGEPRHLYWHKKWSVSVSIRSIHCFYGYPSMRVPPESRMVVKRFPSPAPCSLPVGEVASAARTEGANNGNVNRKMLAPSQADDVPRAQGPLSHLR